jgi:hypothetical protein
LEVAVQFRQQSPHAKREISMNPGNIDDYVVSVELY